MEKAYATGAVIDYVNAGSAISSGDVVTSNDFVGIAITDIAATSGVGSVAIQGVFAVTKASGATWAIGQKLYYDSGSANFTPTAAGNQFAGFAFVAAVSGATTGYILIHPSDLDAFDIFTTRGDFLRAGASGMPERVALGTANKYLMSDGTDVAWSTYTLALAGNITTAAAVTFAGAFAFTATLTNTTGVTFPTTGTLATLGGTETLAAKTLTAPVISGGCTAAGTPTTILDLSGVTTATNALKFADTKGATVGAMTAKNPETDAEAGFLTIVVGSTTYEIPFYAVA